MRRAIPTVAALVAFTIGLAAGRTHTADRMPEPTTSVDLSAGFWLTDDRGSHVHFTCVEPGTTPEPGRRWAWVNFCDMGGTIHVLYGQAE